MGLISPQQISDGTTIDAADVNTPVNTIANEFNGNIDSDNLAANAVGTSEIADGAVTNAKLNTGTGELGGVWQDWTPSWTNLTVGNGTETAKYMQIGKTVHLFYNLTFGSTTSIDAANPRVTLPVNASANFTGAASTVPVNLCKLYEDGVGLNYGVANVFDADEIIIREINTSGSLLTEAAVSATSPFTWGTGDAIIFTATYEAA